MRTRICAKCDRPFEVPTGHRNYLCPECALQAKRESVYRERTCKVCGEPFMGFPNSKYCPKCNEEHQQIRKRKYNNYPSDRTIGSIDHCQSCGKEYIVKSGNQKYCSDCSAEKISEKAKIRARKNISQNKEKNISRKKSHRGKRYVCKICGTIFEKHGAEVTCSPECKKELSRIRQNEADIKRGRRARPASERYESGLPKSGIVGITWRRNGKWTAKYKNHYIGVYDTIDAAKESLEQYKKNLA